MPVKTDSIPLFKHLGRSPYSVKTTFGHLRPYEIDLFKRLVRRKPKLFDSVDFDVQVGTSQYFRGIYPKAIYYDGKQISLWRIDFVGYKANLRTIVELKTLSRASAIGQLLCYQYLYSKSFPNEPVPSLLLVTDQIIPNMDICLSHFSIPYLLV